MIIEKIIKFKENWLQKLHMLAYTTNNRYVYDIYNELNSFFIEIRKDNLIQVNYIPGNFAGRFQEQSSAFLFSLMFFYARFNYRISKTNMFEELKACQLDLQKLIIQCNSLYQHVCKKADFEKIYQYFEEAKEKLQYRIYWEDELNDKNISNEQLEIKNIYDKIVFDTVNYSIEYYDYWEGKTKKANLEKNFLYAILLTYSEAYSKSIMCLKKFDSTGQWCPLTVWQVIRDVDFVFFNVFS